MEGGSSVNTPGSSAPISELEKLQRQHDGKLARIQELKEKKEALMLELENKKRETPDKMKGFDELTEKYNNLRDKYNALQAEKSHDKE